MISEEWHILGDLNISSNINEALKEQFQAFLFFYEEILHTQKKHKTSNK